MRIASLILLILFSAASHAEIYKWIDEQGRVHYGDSPKATDSASIVDVKINSYKHVSYDNIDFYSSSNAKQVVMYGTSWCGFCKKARNYFKQQGISFVEYDIESDSAAKRDYDSLGATGVPVILVGDKRMNGFSEEGFKRIYN